MSKIEVYELNWDKFHTLKGKVPKIKIWGLKWKCVYSLSVQGRTQPSNSRAIKDSATQYSKCSIYSPCVIEMMSVAVNFDSPNYCAMSDHCKSANILYNYGYSNRSANW